MRLLHSVLGLLLSFPALAFENTDPPTTTKTTWEIYGLVLLVFIAGFLWVFYRQKKDRERQQRRRDAGRT